MLSFNDKISIRQLQVLLILDIFGTGVIVLPRRVAEFGDQDGWIVIIIATLIAMIYAYFITSIGRMFPNKSFLEYTSIILSKPIAILISIGFIIKIVIGIAMEIRFFAEIIRQTMLYSTPFIVIFFGIILVSAYAAAKGYETRARIAEVLIYIMFIPLAFVFGVVAFDVDYSNLLPIMKTPPVNLIIGGFFTGISFKGMEFCLLVYPYIQKPKAVRKAVVNAIGFIGILMCFVTIITIGKFGPFDVKRQMWPVLEMMDSIDFPGSFIERQDALIMSFWIIATFSVVNSGLFFSSILLKDIFKKGRHSLYILACIPIVLIIAYIPKSIVDVYNIMEAVFITFGIVYMLIIPLILMLVAKARRLGEKL